eukprot:XP_001704670.1 Hypothetical protein GL50803_98892 [Giardia lamblia ATCC 50803]
MRLLEFRISGPSVNSALLQMHKIKKQPPTHLQVLRPFHA